MPYLSDESCKNIIRNLAGRYNVDPCLVATKLLSKEDKNDMRNGLLPIEVLDAHIKNWAFLKMPDYVNTERVGAVCPQPD